VIVNSLKASTVIEEIQSLLGCDLNYVTSGVSIKEYRSETEHCSKLVKHLRTEILYRMPVHGVQLRRYPLTLSKDVG